MDFIDYFNPVEIKTVASEFLNDEYLFGRNISFLSEKTNSSSIKDVDIAIIGIPDERNTYNKGCAEAPDEIRKKLYQLDKTRFKIKILDLGNLKIGKSPNDTYFALQEVVYELQKNNIVTILLGGGQDITYGNYLAYKRLEQTVNIVSIDSKFDLGDVNRDISSSNYLSKIILDKDSALFSFSNLGYQSYFVPYEEQKVMDKLLFETYRLGKVREDIKEAEPIIRDADIVSVDINSIRQSDAPGQRNPSPNGFYGEEMCQLSKYAGLSDKISSFGIYELNPKFDNLSQTSHLVAQMVWYFVEGFYQRKKDYPFSDINENIKYIVAFEDFDYDIIFYKSPKSGRWWIEVPYQKSEYKKYMVVPCSEKDYNLACEHEIPDVWLKTFHKMS
jgi:arginase family enzyme